MNPGYEYLKNRGFKSDTLKTFDIMYYDGKNNYSFNTTQEKGLCDVAKRLYKDNFGNSIVFPIFDLYNRLVSVSVRRFDNLPKFDYSVFDKRYILYGFNATYKDILEKDAVFITEGQFDFLMLWQHGIKNCVSSCGCNLTFEQMTSCMRFTKNFYIIYDNDEPGKVGVVKAQKLIKAHDGNCKIIYLPCDLDEYLLKNGTEAFLKYAQITKSL
jgi:DNA primase